MRRSSILFHVLGTAGLVGLLSGCGGGGDSGTSAPVAGSAALIVSSGTITDFGSVYINDRKYEINDSTTTTKDDSTVAGDNNAKGVLRRGMVVTVSGTSSGTTRTAATIVHQNTLEGPIQTKGQIDASNGTLIVLGQTVVVDASTKFDDTSTPAKLNSLSVNDVIEVSGFVKEDTTGVFIMASFIERKFGATVCSSICEVKGKITSHTPLQNTFQIGALTVNYAPPADITDMPSPNAVNWVGLLVEVKGSNFNAGMLTATKVEREGFQAPNGNQVELEGYVTSLFGGAGSGQFMIGTTTVQATNALYLGGTIAEVAVGQKLEVEGSISNNVIAATKVKFQDSVRLEGIVNSIVGSTMTLGGLPTITITSNSATEFKGNIPGVGVGHRVKVRGRDGATVNGIVTVIATEVDGNGPDNCNTCDVSLQGAVQAIPTPNQTLTILGVLVNTNGFTDPDDFQGLTDQPIGRAAFFNAVTVGTLVKVKGRLTGGLVTWREAELED